MRELMTSVEVAERYSNAWRKFPSIVLLALFAVVVADVISILVNLYNYFTLNTYLNNFYPGNNGSFGIGAGLLVLVAWIPIGYAMYRILRSSLRKPMDGAWREDLEEGAIGILKIMEDMDWNQKLMELRRAKLVFVFFSILQLLLSWVIVFILLYIGLFYLMLPFYNAVPNIYVEIVLSVVIVLGLGDRYISQKYGQLWNMDNLISELRWFYFEFEGTEFQA